MKKMLVCFKIDPHSPLQVPFPKENSVAHRVVWCLYLCSGSCVLDSRMESKGQLYGVAAAALCISLAWRNLRALWLGHSHQLFLPVQSCGSLLSLPCSYCLIEHKNDLGRAATGWRVGTAPWRYLRCRERSRRWERLDTILGTRPEAESQEAFAQIMGTWSASLGSANCSQQGGEELGELIKAFIHRFNDSSLNTYDWWYSKEQTRVVPQSLYSRGNRKTLSTKAK